MRGKTHCTIGVLTSIQTCILFNIPITILNLIICAILSIFPDIDEPHSTIYNLIFKKNLSKKNLKKGVYILSIIISIIILKSNNFYLILIALLGSFILFSLKFNYSLFKKIFLSLIFLFFCIMLYLNTNNLTLLAFSLTISIFPWLKHRSFSHSLVAVFIIYLFLKEIEKIYHIPFLSIIGTLSYLSHMFLGDIFTKSGVPIFYPLTSKKFSLAPFVVGTKKCNLLEYAFISVLILTIFISILK